MRLIPRAVDYIKNISQNNKRFSKTLQRRKSAIRDYRPMLGLVLCGVCVVLCGVFCVAFVYWCVM